MFCHFFDNLCASCWPNWENIGDNDPIHQAHQGIAAQKQALGCFRFVSGTIGKFKTGLVYRIVIPNIFPIRPATCAQVIEEMAKPPGEGQVTWDWLLSGFKAAFKDLDG